MISDTKKYAILWLNYTGKDPKTISKELKVPFETVKDIINETSNTNKEENNFKKIDSKNLMITHTSGKKANSVAIMTKEASEVNDAKNKNPKAHTNKNIKGIFKPKG